MNPVLLVGVLHLTGLRKKDNEPYDFYLLQYIDVNCTDSRVIGKSCVNDVACEPDMLLRSGIDLGKLVDGFQTVYVSFDRRGNLINLRVKED